MLPLFIVWVCCVGTRVESDDEAGKRELAGELCGLATREQGDTAPVKLRTNDGHRHK